MSVKIMGMVFDANLNTTQKFVLLALADHADSEGGSIFPSVATVAHKCSLSESAVEKAIRALKKQGLLIQVRQGGGNCTNLWRIDLTVLATLTPVPRTPLPPYHVHPTPVPRTPDPSYNHPGTVPGASGDAARAAKPPAKRTRTPRLSDPISDLIALSAYSAPKGTGFTSVTANRLLKALSETPTAADAERLLSDLKAMYGWWVINKPTLSAPGKYEAISRALAEWRKQAQATQLVYVPVEQPDGTFRMEWINEPK